MSPRPRIATYLPHRSIESAAATKALAAGAGDKASPPTPEELAELSRALQLLELSRPQPGVMTAVPDSLASNLQTFMAMKAQEQGRLQMSKNNTLEAQFDSHDILGWAGSFFTWYKKLNPFRWCTPSETDKTSKSQFRVAILGDWGTGLYGAPACAATIAKNGKYDLIVHLGDVYYSGTDSEYEERFTKLWPQVSTAKSIALNGNHEMYTGGQAYFAAIQHFGQTASYCAIENDRWVLAFLDSAYSDHDLHGDQAAWLTSIAARSPNKKLVLFSHHQPFSLLDVQGPKLITKLSTLLQQRRIFAWYWGHEHHCILYDKHPLWDFSGRCVGHSGFPYFRETAVLGDTPPAKADWKPLSGKNLVPGARMVDGANVYIEDDPQRYGPNGYMSLEFDGEELNEIVHESDGNQIWNQPLT